MKPYIEMTNDELNAELQNLRAQYTHVPDPGEEFVREKLLVKGADKLSAYLKCIEERKAGNREFESAERSTLQALHEMKLEEVEIFLREFIPAYEKTLDEIRP
jgi:5'-deoxynucleotidase